MRELNGGIHGSARDGNGEAYETEYAYWKYLTDTFNSVKPDPDTYFSEPLYRKCATHYEKAEVAFSQGRVTRGGKMLINLDSIINLTGALAELKKQRYLSQHLLDKSDRLVALCEYVLKLHGE